MKHESYLASFVQSHRSGLILTALVTEVLVSPAAGYHLHFGAVLAAIVCILKPETIAIMTTPASPHSASSPAKYPRGSYVRDNGKGNGWHYDTSLPSTTSIMVPTSNGMCWGALTNTRTQP